MYFNEEKKYAPEKDIDHMIYKYIKCIILKFVGYSLALVIYMMTSRK